MRTSSGSLVYDPDSTKYFDVSGLDSALLSDALWFHMRSTDLHQYWFWSSFLSLLARDPDTDRIALIRIASMLHTYISATVAERLLENPVVQIDRDVLTLLATLPVFRGDAYAQVRVQAEEYLNALD